jgi:hypothetical protein
VRGSRELELEELLSAAQNKDRASRREMKDLKKVISSNEDKFRLLQDMIRSTQRSLDKLAKAVQDTADRHEAERLESESEHKEEVRLLRAELQTPQLVRGGGNSIPVNTFGAGSSYSHRSATPITTEEWEVSTGTIHVDPRNPPAFLERFYAKAGWPPTFPDQDAIPAPRGEMSMMDSYRTTAEELRDIPVDSTHFLYELMERMLFYEFPARPVVNTRILMMQSTDLLWEELSKPPLSMDKLSKSCLCSSDYG